LHAPSAPSPDLRIEPLSGDDLWGGSVADERYALSARI
jgi:hypothetical protein